MAGGIRGGGGETKRGARFFHIRLCVGIGSVRWHGPLPGVGVYEGYLPEQPLKFIHSVHVCENEVDCKYCHQRL